MPVYRDPVRFSHGRFVKASGLRWPSLMLLVPIPWAERIRALPFLVALAPSERCSCKHGRRHRKLIDWGQQAVLQARHWLPGRDLLLVADSSHAAVEPLAALSRRGLACVTRLRLDAALCTPAPPRPPGTIGRPQVKGTRLANLSAALADAGTTWQRVTVPGWHGEDEGEGEGGRIVDLCSGAAVWRHAGLPVVPVGCTLVRDPLGRFGPQALLCTDPGQKPEQALRWLVQRRQLGATFQGRAAKRTERAHLGVETRCQRPDLAIARCTSCLLGLFSLATLLAAQLSPKERRTVTASAWHRKRRPTFSDTLAAVRRHVRHEQGFTMSRHAGDVRKLQPALREGITYALCHAA